MVISRDVTFIEHLMLYLAKADEDGKKEDSTQVEVEHQDQFLEPVINVEDQSQKPIDINAHMKKVQHTPMI